jgi:hypothetical protein
VHPNIARVLDTIKKEINNEYGFHDGIPRINYGPCGVFAHIFLQSWNRLFNDKVHICFIMTQSLDECDHVCICLPTGELYDGGIGIHNRQEYEPEFIINDMIDYDDTILEKWSYGLNRTYPRYCPNFNRDVVQRIVQSNLEKLSSDSVHHQL